ncbi:hypothetical protein [Pectobacterium brasiliense]|uniref:hypothetical protein n=1 Tax=Pectobacterium brasiliense TaxID=180957 RepID=UPI0019695A07|nr:hypothetical protein [Pectobacterium brasiliense]MBN3262961.1 hypothetical protein [Pectobacterium brasiliense]
MKKKSNLALLSEIRTDIFLWQNKHECPGGKQKRLIFIFSLLPFMYLCLSYIDSLKLLFLAVIIGPCLLHFIVGVFTRNIKNTWQEDICLKLSRYKPINEEAWAELKASASSGGEVSIDALLFWLDKEMDAVKPKTLVIFNRQMDSK